MCFRFILHNFSSSVFTEESWDDDYGPTYDPSLVMAKKPYAQQVNYLSKGERKNYRASEIQRVQSLQNPDNSNAKSERTSDQSPIRKPLRKPAVSSDSAYDNRLTNEISAKF